MTDKEDMTVEESLENALEHAENEEVQYWIRTALQQLVAEREEPERSPPDED